MSTKNYNPAFGDDYPNTGNFNDNAVPASAAFWFGLSEPIVRAISDSGYSNPTPIQEKSIPVVMAGRDLLAGAQTGTGKTAAFTLPILHKLSAAGRIKPANGRPRCLILTPTRELAAQIEDSIKTYGKYTPVKSTAVFGGISIVPQIRALTRPVDILVATPGRLLDHLRQKTVDLSKVEIFVLDEADRMLDMGFIRDIKKITALLPESRQSLFFSATLSEEIKDLSRGMMKDFSFIETARRNTVSELVEHSVHLIPQQFKSSLLSHLIKENKWKQVLVFTRTKHGADRLTKKLVSDGISAAAIHSGKSQSHRTAALSQFKNASVSILVATDIAARGLNITQLPHVVNFELPNSSKDYVHRIGRTGRAGCNGKAISLVGKEEYKFLREIEKLIKMEIPRISIEGFSQAQVQAEVIDNTQSRGHAHAHHAHGRKHANVSHAHIHAENMAIKESLSEDIKDFKPKGFSHKKKHERGGNSSGRRATNTRSDAQSDNHNRSHNHNPYKDKATGKATVTVTVTGAGAGKTKEPGKFAKPGKRRRNKKLYTFDK